jgi:hypothetical protein
MGRGVQSELKSEVKRWVRSAVHQHQTVDNINDITKDVDCRTVQLRVGPEFVELRALQALFNLVAFWAGDRTLGIFRRLSRP